MEQQRKYLACIKCHIYLDGSRCPICGPVESCIDVGRPDDPKFSRKGRKDPYKSPDQYKD